MPIFASWKKNEDSDEELNTQKDELYDSDADDKDESYFQKMTSSKNQDGTMRVTDAVLSCAMCLTPICFDCQRHSSFHDQYRAMFVCNVELNLAEILYHPEPNNATKFDSAKATPASCMLETLEDPAQLLDENSFFAAHCQNCRTQVGVYDYDELYHLFNVISSSP
ncbi:hypothetical protein DSO57_1034778 [Entomophthora muscae]|uniref:Uncharacterized protein n=2 Tax=Entomophthora muscae TaxID=34485 RepID=A0ACC2UAI4_9FUNG|nr:hypothetical protein DSO57_1034778 [Entomophthora muscae]